MRLITLTLGALLLGGALGVGCGGGSGTEPTLESTLLAGRVTFGANLPDLAAQAGVPRFGNRVIDPGENIASVPFVSPVPITVDDEGRFRFEGLPVIDRPLYLETTFSVPLDLRGDGSPSTAVVLNLPIRTEAEAELGADLFVDAEVVGGEPIGLFIRATYIGPDGARSIETILDYRTSRVRHDLNGDLTLDDGDIADANRDSLDDGRAAWDVDPAAFVDVERYGQVTAITRDTVSVGGLTFLISNSTNMWDLASGDALLLTDFDLTEQVFVAGYEVGGGMHRATALRRDVAPTSEVHPVTRRGTLTARDGDLLVVGGLSIRTNAATLITIPDFVGSPTVENLEIGDALEIEIERRPTGLLVDAITKLEPSPESPIAPIVPPVRPAPEQERAYAPGLQPGGATPPPPPTPPAPVPLGADGRIESLGANSLTVGGVTFAVSESTVIRDALYGYDVPFATLRPEHWVTITGAQQGTAIRALTIVVDFYR